MNNIKAKANALYILIPSVSHPYNQQKNKITLIYHINHYVHIIKVTE